MPSRTMHHFLELEKELAYFTGSQLDGINFTRKNDHWTMVVKVTSPKGSKLVTFIDAHSIYDCISFLLSAIHTTQVTLKWYPDKFRT